MYKKKWPKKKITILIMLIVLMIALLGISLTINRKTGNIESILKDIVVTVQKIAIYPFTALNKEKNQTQSESYFIPENVIKMRSNTFSHDYSLQSVIVGNKLSSLVEKIFFYDYLLQSVMLPYYQEIKVIGLIPLL